MPSVDPSEALVVSVCQFWSEDLKIELRQILGALFSRLLKTHGIDNIDYLNQKQ